MKRYTAACDTCGWESNPCTTPAMADYAKRSHSCERHLAKVAAAERGRARDAAVDRTPKPCHHKRTTHQHGTYACYVLDRCRCNDCGAANTTYERDRVRNHAYGRWNNMVDTQPARDHLARLRQHGMGLRTISRRTGLSESTLGKIVYGDPARGMVKSKRIRSTTQDKILAVTVTRLEDLADGARVDGVGTRRRLQALMCLGWSQSRLAEKLNYSPRNFNHLIHGKRTVTVRNARNTRALYDQLWNQEPPSGNRWQRSSISRAKAYAAEHGWVPPMAWSDDELDDPRATPAAPSRPTQHRAEHVAEDVEFLLEHEPLLTTRQLANRLGYTDVGGVRYALKRAGRTDILATLARNARIEQGEAA